ncbi:MAG: hypothetical protein JWN34_2582 [Bryobacterales bacterium]|nr:hypothetical protein [Bryobacterales bacterium]
MRQNQHRTCTRACSRAKVSSPITYFLDRSGVGSTRRALLPCMAWHERITAATPCPRGRPGCCSGCGAHPNRVEAAVPVPGTLQPDAIHDIFYKHRYAELSCVSGESRRQTGGGSAEASEPPRTVPCASKRQCGRAASAYRLRPPGQTNTSLFELDAASIVRARFPFCPNSGGAATARTNYSSGFEHANNKAVCAGWVRSPFPAAGHLCSRIRETTSNPRKADSRAGRHGRKEASSLDPVLSAICRPMKRRSPVRSLDGFSTAGVCRKTSFGSRPARWAATYSWVSTRPGHGTKISFSCRAVCPAEFSGTLLQVRLVRVFGCRAARF